MDAYAIVKTVHIISATVLFGSGIGTAFFFWRAHAPGNEMGRLAVTRTTVLADWLFTTPAVPLQPVTGAWLVARAVARQGHGPFIPCMPAILLARRLARNLLIERGARPCLDLIDLDEFLSALRPLDIGVIHNADE